MFEEGQVFEETYPPEAAEWCNGTGAHHIEEIEPDGETRRFKIVANAEWVPTAEERIAVLQMQLESTDYIAAKAMDALISCDSITGFLSTMAAFREQYGDKIDARRKWREEINSLQG